MKENNLLAELAAYLFSRSQQRDRPDAVGARAGRAFFGQPRPDPRGAGDPRSHAHRRAARQVRHLPDHPAGQRRGDGAVRQGRRAARSRSRSTRRSSCGRSTRSRRPSSPARAPPRRISSGCARSCRPRRSGSPRAKALAARGPRFPSGDRAGDPEQRLPQDLQRLLRDGRAAPADLFQRSRARPQVACRASADLRRAAAARRQSRAGADERASAGRRELLEGPDQRGSTKRPAAERRSKRPEQPCRSSISTHPLHPRAAAMLAERRRARRSPRRSTPGRWRRKAARPTIVIVRAPLPPELFERAPKLRAAIRHGAGLDMIPVEAATEGRRAGRQRAGRQRALGRRARDLRRDGAAPALPHGRPRPAQAWLAGRARARRVHASELAGRTIGIVGVGSVGTAVDGDRAQRLRPRGDRQQPQPEEPAGRCPLRHRRRARRRSATSSCSAAR